MMLNTTGYGFARTATNGIHPEQWEYILKWDTITWNGQDASPTAVRLHIQWDEYEPTLGNYYGTKLNQAVEAILAKGMKVALHFPYQRKGRLNDSYFSSDHIAKLKNGTLVADDYVMACPSFYSHYAMQRFYAFVDNALAAVSSHYNDIVFVAMGNTTAEETGIPWLSSNLWQPGFYEDSALKAWRTEYLTCRFPGQSTVIFGGTSYNISSAPVGEPNSFDQTWKSDLQKEYHRFAGWGLRRLVKGFRDVVKNRSSSLKVLNFISDFGGKQSNVFHLHSSSIPILHQETDGTYTSDGDSPFSDRLKIMALDILKGTDPSKIAAVEFDPEDLGRPAGTNNINQADAMEWIPRAFKHGADIVMLAMHFHDPMITQLRETMRYVRANYTGVSYTPPTRQAVSATVNIVPGVFDEFQVYEGTWNAQGGNNFSVSDNNPVSIAMSDNGYWQNALSCSGTPDPCAFTVSASSSNGSPTVNTSVTLTASCSGECTGVTYSWSGNGISGTNSTVTFNAPGTAGTYTYTLTAGKSGCTNKTATVQLNVQAGGGGGTTTCTGTIDLCSGNTFEIRSGTVNVSGAGTYAIVLTSRSHEGPATGRIRFNGGSWSNYSLPQTGVNEYIETALGDFTLNNGNNTVDLSSNGGFICFRKVCATGGSGCSTPSAPTLSASPSTINSGSSSTLSASGCSGGTITWSDGLGTGTSKSVSPTATKTYTATCSIGGCTSSNGSVTVTVNTSGVTCNQLQGYFDVVNCDIIAGWIYDAAHPNDVVYVDLYEGSTLIQGNIAANIFRQDLVDAGKGNGVHGYSISTPATLKNGTNRVLTMKQTSCNYTLIWAPKTINCSGGSVVLGTVDPDEMSRVKGLLISPNPNKGIFETSFYLEKGKKATITVVDLQGRVMYSRMITGQGSHREKINLSNKASGTMLLQLHKDSGVETKKINITR